MAQEPRSSNPAPRAQAVGRPVEDTEGMPPGGPLGVSRRLQEELEAALRREQERLRRKLGQASGELARRETELAARLRELEAREQRIAETLQSTREMGMRIESEARAQAAEIVGQARHAAAETAAETRQRYTEFERTLAVSESEIVVTQTAAHEEANRLRETAGQEAKARIDEAQRQADQIIRDARQQAQEQTDRMLELLRLREGLTSSLRETMTQFEQALQRAGAGEVPFLGPASDASLEVKDERSSERPKPQRGET